MSNYQVPQQLLTSLIIKKINKKQPLTVPIITLNTTLMLHLLNIMKLLLIQYSVRERRDMIKKVKQILQRNILKSIKLINLIKPNQKAYLFLSSPNLRMILRIAREIPRWKGDVVCRPAGLLRFLLRLLCSPLCRHIHRMSSVQLNHLEILIRELIIIKRENPEIKSLKKLHYWHLNLRENANLHHIVSAKERIQSNLSARITTPSSWLWKL